MAESSGDPLWTHRGISRRGFLSGAAASLAGVAAWRPAPAAQADEPIIDIHQHVGYSGRPDDVLLAHQQAMGITTTILLPAGRPVARPSTHDGKSNGLDAQAAGNAACFAFAQAHRGAFAFGANEVPDLEDARDEIVEYLDRGAIIIGEQKFGVACDSPAMQNIYALARERRVPVLMHWQFGMYNDGFDRLGTILSKYHDVDFIGHAQTWWANIDANHRDQSVMYPKGPVTPGGLTDRYLADYGNIYADLSAGSGYNALTRDEEFTRGFMTRHQDKLVYGSDCSDHVGSGPKCTGAGTIAVIRRLAGAKAIERKLLHDNAKKLLRGL